MKNVVISTMGTSLITNLASKEEQDLLYKYSNYEESEYPKEVKTLVDSLLPKASKVLDNSDVKTLRRMCAELNGILGFYNEELSAGNGDYHFLICTDTYQGKKSANLIENFLNKKNFFCKIFTPEKLSTKNKNTFSDGIKKLLEWFDTYISGFKESGYQIIFNLTGSFKSLQGYLNTIGMFYADKIIYIFESEQSELIEIPRLPIQIDIKPFEKNKEKLLLLNANKTYEIKEFVDFPESAFDSIDGKLHLSVWGKVIWNKVKYDLFEELPVLPYIEYYKSFREQYKNEINKNNKLKILEKIAEVSVLLEESKGDTTSISKGGIQFSPLKSKFFCNKQVYHFRVDLSLRINCTKNDNNKLSLIEYGTHDETQR